ncbi:MAG TPA: AAA family ATPase, partial [Dehalococcoidia bacterium]|nr:AAA family ATPase [Dehalococcoidia bacterium]
PSGCGKTTLARILKTELNCHDMDFKEMNCADFRGIDTIREISRLMHLAPTGGSVRIWLLDEVHQLSKDGQHAALKILEDTPSHVYFFLCTTDPQKLLKTIQTRCCNMPVRLLTHTEVGSLVQRVCKREKVPISEDVLEEIVSSAQGSARTALVCLDKVLNLSEGERVEAIQQTLADENEAIELCRALIKKDTWPKVAGILKNLKGEPESIRYAVLGYARAVLLKNTDHQAYKVICAFENNFYDSKAAGLIRASFEAIFV